MRLATHLKISPHGVFYFRIVIPACLRPMFHGRREFKKSLFTRDPKLAKLWAYALSARVGAKLEEARQAMKKNYDSARFDPNDPSTWPGAADIGRYEIEFSPGGAIKLKVDPNTPGDHEKAMEAAQKLLEDPYLREQQEKKRLNDEAVRDAVAQAIDLGMSGMGIGGLTAPVMAPAMLDYTPIRLSEAIAKYEEEDFPNFKPSTQKAYKRTLKWFPQFFQQDPFMHEITETVVRDWKNKVLIPHFQKVAEGKMASDIAGGKIVVDPLVGMPKVSFEIRSVDGQITNLNAFFQTMQDASCYPSNMRIPSKKQTVVSHAARKLLPGWQHFEEAELKQIFDSANLLSLEKPHEFWMPLLGLFTGGRLNELAQLTHKDIHQENGIWVLRIRDQDYYQSTKNKASVRKIPLHPKLIELGFLDYLTDAREAVPDIERIFPYLRHDYNNGFGDVPSEAFARYLDSLQIYSRKKVLHSFRTNSNDRLKQNGIGEEQRCQMVGHVHETTNSRVYGNPYPVDFLLKNVAPKLDFPEIDFSLLKYTPGRFRDMLPKEVTAALNRKRKNKGESLQLHKESKAARDARSEKKKWGRPVKE